MVGARLSNGSGPVVSLGMRSGWRWIGALVLPFLSVECTGVQYINPAGRPCDDEHPCGPGTTCDPATSRCVTSTALDHGPGLLDARPDRSTGDGPAADLGGDGPLDDLDPLPDTTPPCQGLTCPLGCNIAEDRCLHLAPSNVPPSTVLKLEAGATATLAGKDIELSTLTGQVKVDGAVVRASGSAGTSVSGVYWEAVSQGSSLPAIALFGVGALELQAGGTLTVTGSRATLIYASEQVTLEGTLSASAGRPAAAPGGFAGGSANNDAASCFGGGGKKGSLGGCTSPACESGGGGGGRKASGGNGGIPAPNGTPGGAGGASNGGSSLVPLYGGCGGGGGGGAASGDGGGGGGAVQISTSGALVVTGSGVISMPGAGGEKGYFSDYQGGAGGGSGGAILLEGATVQVQGVLAANGGGGGSEQNGEDGTASAAAAQGGPTGINTGAGGAGGATATETGGAGVGGTAKNDGGGGGGAAGRIRINSPSSTLGGVISPTPSTSSSVATW